MNPLQKRTSLCYSEWIYYLFSLGMLCGIAVVLSIAMVYQYVYFELPCPLCLLQRYAFFGIAFGVMALLFVSRYSINYLGISLLSSVYLLVVGARHSLINIIPRPNHAWVGSPILGLHMPVWSVVIALLCLVSISLYILMVNHNRLQSLSRHESPTFIRYTLYFLSGYLLFLCGINWISIFVQCGFGVCRKSGYWLFGLI